MKKLLFVLFSVSLPILLQAYPYNNHRIGHIYKKNQASLDAYFNEGGKVDYLVINGKRFVSSDKYINDAISSGARLMPCAVLNDDGGKDFVVVVLKIPVTKYFLNFIKYSYEETYPIVCIFEDLNTDLPACRTRCLLKEYTFWPSDILPLEIKNWLESNNLFSLQTEEEFKENIENMYSWKKSSSWLR